MINSHITRFFLGVWFGLQISSLLKIFVKRSVPAGTKEGDRFNQMNILNI